VVDGHCEGHHGVLLDLSVVELVAEELAPDGGQ
jgi:hypothetical protein